jgi:hypothetical protein
VYVVARTAYSVIGEVPWRALLSDENKKSERTGNDGNAAKPVELLTNPLAAVSGQHVAENELGATLRK